jgi:hypothetical protein
MFWQYINDRCDHAGVWVVNMDVAKTYLRFTPTIDMVKGMIIEVSDVVWFIPSFVWIQYGRLYMSNRAHRSVIEVMERHDVYGKFCKLSATAVNEPVEIAPLIREREPSFETPTVEDVQNYCAHRSNGVNPQKFVDFYTAKDWMIGKNKMKDWRAAVRTWENKDATTVTVGEKKYL